MLEYIVLVLDFLPSHFKTLILGFLAVFGLFIIAKVVVLVKDVVFKWL